MKLSFVPGEAGFVPETLDTKAIVNLEIGKISESHLVLKATVKGISKEVFDSAVKEAELNCPISLSQNAKISVEPTLNA